MVSSLLLPSSRFGSGTIGRRRGAIPRAGGARPAGNVDPEFQRTLLSERARLARQIDIELRVASRMEAAARREVGVLARDLLRRRAYQRLGFVRVSDYARERLGVSARTLQSAAWVATRLEALPEVAAAFDRCELSWTQTRAVCAVAVPADQAAWLARARECTVEQLQSCADAARAGRPEAPGDPEPESGDIDGEPAILLRIACPARARALWRHALELASRVAGEPLADWRAAEIIAAEGLSGRPAGTAVADRALAASIRLAKDARRSGAPVAGVAAADAGAAAAGAPASGAGVTGAVASTADATPFGADLPSFGKPEPALPTGGTADPFALDARLIDAFTAIRKSEPRIGRLLRIIVDHHLYRRFGFSSLAAYVRERLGISSRKAWALLKVEKISRRSGAFASAYESGRVSWVRALTLLPVLDHDNAAHWIARATTVTARRLADEVNFVLESRDCWGAAVPLDPPPLDSPLPSPAARLVACNTPHDRRLQIGAHCEPPADRSAYEICDVEVRFVGPASVVALFRDALDAFAEAGAPRWWALERCLRHVISCWTSLPRHHDPIFERDGWRCTVPACSSRRNLHDHHIEWRSHGGGNARENRLTICASHHLRGIHTGVVRASGTAPSEVRWQLGVPRGTAPLLSYVGDRLCLDDIPAREVAAGS